MKPESMMTPEELADHLWNQMIDLSRRIGPVSSLAAISDGLVRAAGMLGEKQDRIGAVRLLAVAGIVKRAAREVRDQLATGVEV
jgi:hypothetical protein